MVTVYKHVNHWKGEGILVQSNTVLTGERLFCVAMYLLIAMSHLRQYLITTAAIQDAQETKARYPHVSKEHSVFISLQQLSWIVPG